MSYNMCYVNGQLSDRKYYLTGLLNLQHLQKNVTFMWHSNDMFHYMPKAKFVTL